MSLWADKYRPCSLARLDYHREQAAGLRSLVRRRAGAQGGGGRAPALAPPPLVVAAAVGNNKTVKGKGWGGGEGLAGK